MADNKEREMSDMADRLREAEWVELAEELKRIPLAVLLETSIMYAKERDAALARIALLEDMDKCAESEIIFLASQRDKALARVAVLEAEAIELKKKTSSMRPNLGFDDGQNQKREGAGA
jgi:hypothetical protein